MSGDHTLTVEEKMKQQRQSRQKQEQYNHLAGLGWKSFGAAFLVIVIGIAGYGVFFN